MVADTSKIRVHGARENNLKNVNLVITKRKITVFTGVSGSGKSSLVFDTLAEESQRQLAETFSAFARHRMAHHTKPDVDRLENLTAAIVIDQKRLGGGPRSTLGTVTDIGPMLRLLYSRAGEPFFGYSNVFSFNNPDGMCQVCQGLGFVTEIDPERMVDRDKSLNEGALRFSMFRKGGVRWKRYVTSGLFDPDKKLREYSDEEWQMLMFARDHVIRRPPAGYPQSGEFEGVIPKFERLHVNVEGNSRHAVEVARFVVTRTCPACKGQRLRPEVLACKIGGRSIGDANAMPVSALREFVGAHRAGPTAIVSDGIVEQLGQMERMGLGYLTLSRATSTLSGGESQRIKMVRHLGSSLVDMTYIFDEPSTGLHPADVHQVNSMLTSLRDKGNTILVVEHDPDIIEIADEVVDMGPGAGTNGGRMVFQGTVEELRASRTLTGISLNARRSVKPTTRTPIGWLEIRNAKLHNLKGVSTRIPMGVITVVTGVAGSGKSSLVRGVLPTLAEDFVLIDQGAIRGSRRSSVATYSGLMDEIRRSFAGVNGVEASIFSQNSKGACPACKGTGIVSLDLAFMDAVESPCEICGGSGFNEESLSYLLDGRNIAEFMALSVEEAAATLIDSPVTSAVFARLQDVGLSYVSLGQTLDTLSGGERQRLKLATELERSGGLVIMDEPTTGLHMADVARLLLLMDRMVEEGKTLIVIEHNLDVVLHADWVIDMGPGAGDLGGQVVFEGVPADLASAQTPTGEFLSSYMRKESK